MDAYHSKAQDRKDTYGHVHEVVEKHSEDRDRDHDPPRFNPISHSLPNLLNQPRRRNRSDSPSSLTPVHHGDQPLPEGSETIGHRHHHHNGNGLILTPELFEKLYLSPQNAVKGDLRSTFGNPTPLALLGFLLSLSPLSCELMGLRGAGGNGMATIGAYYFIGGFLMSLGGILEFFLGNTFAFVVFCSFGGFWFTLGATLTPAFNAYGAYSPVPTDPSQGLTSAGFHASFGFFLLFMGLLSFIFLICSLRTNIAFVAIFTGLMMTFAILTGVYWNIALGNIALANSLQYVAGMFGLLATGAGWWIFFAQMLASVDFPLNIPVGDISHLIAPMSARTEARTKEKGGHSA